MNYAKKRKRQLGRQLRKKPAELEYKIWLDEECNLITTMGYVPMKNVTEKELSAI